MTQAFNLSQFANRVNTSGQADLTTAVTGTLPIANGGTGQTTANTALNALLPSQTGNSGRYLATDGTNTSWTAPSSFGGSATTAMTTNITLTSSSPQLQILASNANGRTVTLPNATTVSMGTAPFVFINNGGFPILINDASGNLVAELQIGMLLMCSLSSNATTSGVWRISSDDYYLNSISTNLASRTSKPSNGSGTYVIGLSATTFAVCNSRFAQFNSGGDDYAQCFIDVTIATISGSTISFGTTYSTNISGSLYQGTTGNFGNIAGIRGIRLSNTSLVIGVAMQYSRFAGANNMQTYTGVVCCTVSGSVVTTGTAVGANIPAVSVNGGTAYFGLNYSAFARISDTSFGILYPSSMSAGNIPNGTLNHEVCTVSGTTITVGTPVAQTSSTNFRSVGLALLTTNTLIATYTNNTNVFYGAIITASGTTTTWGGNQVLATLSFNASGYSDDINGSSIAVVSATNAYVAYASASYIAYVTISGTTITVSGQQNPASNLSGNYLYLLANGVAIPNSRQTAVFNNSGIAITSLLSSITGSIAPLGVIGTATTFVIHDFNNYYIGSR